MGRAEYIQGVLKNSGLGHSMTTHADLFCGSRVTSAQARLLQDYEAALG